MQRDLFSSASPLPIEIELEEQDARRQALLDRVEARALEIWRQRQMDFPKFVRRMKPDDLDHATGAWAIVLETATLQIIGEEAARADLV